MQRPSATSARLRAFRALATCLLLFLLASASFLIAETAPDVSVSGYLSTHSIAGGEQLGFTVIVKNKSAVALKTLRLVRSPDGYEFGQVWVLRPKAEPGQSGSSPINPDKEAVLDELPANDSVVVWGYLKPAGAHKGTLLLPISWEVGAGAQATTTPAVVNLGENQVRRWYEEQWISDLTKILAVPFLLAILTAMVTYAFDWLAKNREKRDADRKEIADRARLEAERVTAVRTEIWKQMLPVSHRYASQFYLPLSTAAERLVQNLGYWQKNHSLANQKVAFFYVLFVGKRLTVTRNKIGGFYFKDLRGEILAAECWRKQRRALLGKESTPFNMAVKAAVDLLSARETYQSFEERFENKSGAKTTYLAPDIQKAWNLFQAWSARKSRVDYVSRYLKGFYAIMDYESNRPYEYWYEVPARLKLTEALEKMLRTLAAENQYTQQEIDGYFAKVLRVKD